MKSVLFYVINKIRPVSRFANKRHISSFSPTFFLVLDFEATCEKRKKIVQEIIEFPCIKLRIGNQLREEGRFHRYVKPVLCKELPVFCSELTGIIQDMVEDEHEFKTTIEMFEEWRHAEALTEQNSVYVTSGDWDLGKMLPNQCQLSGVEVPLHMHRWIELKRLYGNTTGMFPSSLKEMVAEQGLQFYGRQHSGIGSDPRQNCEGDQMRTPPTLKGRLRKYIAYNMLATLAFSLGGAFVLKKLYSDPKRTAYSSFNKKYDATRETERLLKAGLMQADD